MTVREAALAGLVRRACVWEATARKPGNVHPGAAFADLTFEDFVTSGRSAAAPLASALRIGVGMAVKQAVTETRSRVATNTNLGMVILIAPLAAVRESFSLAEGIGSVLRDLTAADSEAVYEAIRLARPGGLGRVGREDVSQRPSGTLVEVMALAADRDLVARQYVTGFADVLWGAESLRAMVPGEAWRAETESLPEGVESAVIRLHLELLARHPDSLIARKCGPQMALEASRKAAAVLETGLDTAAGIAKLSEFDTWLRADGHRRNPGTTADLVAASLFAVLREGLWCGSPGPHA